MFALSTRRRCDGTVARLTTREAHVVVCVS